MMQEIEQYLEFYPKEIVNLYTAIREILFLIDGITIEEKMWAKLPSYYCGEKFVRIIPFKDHINIEAAGLVKHKNKLKEFKFTPKGMLQIKAGQNIKTEILKAAFFDTYM